MNSVYTVGQLNHYIKNMFSQDFLLGKVKVSGEISNLKDHPSGHIYFSLKDKDSVIACVMFAGMRRGLKCRLSEGLKVLISGSVEVYEAGGKYQLYAHEIEEQGQGDLYQKFIELKKRLEEMGMFDASYKKPIPKYARTIGIVTASSGAALQDILQISERRNPYVRLILSPALVQGDGAPESIVRAIERLDRIHPDIMIVGRGGGSLEDLWAFNDERVARAIFDADTPVISAVGHEIDFTIADFVSDLRAPTPSAAAELAVFDYHSLAEKLTQYADRMENSVSLHIFDLRAKLEKARLKLKFNHPSVQLLRNRERLSLLSEKLTAAVFRLEEKREQKLKLLSGKLDGLSPLRKLKGGFGYISSNGKAVSDVKALKPGDEIKIRMESGEVKAEVNEVIC